MLLVSHKAVFMENEAVLLCQTMREHAGGFAATIQCITFLYSFCHYKAQFWWCIFQAHLGMGARHFQKYSSQNEIFSLLVTFHLPYSQYMDVKTCFHQCVFQYNFFNSCRLVSLVQHFCCTRVVGFALVLHSCCLCLALVL